VRHERNPENDAVLVFQTRCIIYIATNFETLDQWQR
jgi:hypothetical protein